METLDIKGFPVETHIAGSGPPLLYLHAEQYFEQVRPYLDALAKKWRVIAPRHPGYGAASGATDLRSVDDLAYLYLDLLDELKLDNVVLVGASFGGWIALEMCVRNHARLRKLVLVSSVGVKFSGREERDFADLFYMPDIEAFPMIFADWQRYAPRYAAMSSGQLEELARERAQLFQQITTEEARLGHGRYRGQHQASRGHAGRRHRAHDGKSDRGRTPRHSAQTAALSDTRR